MIQGIEKDAGSLNRSIEEQRSQLGNVSQLLEQMAGRRAEIDEKIGELEELRGQLDERRLRRAVDAAERAKLNDKVVQLEAESNKVVGIFDAARLEAQRTVEAAMVYKEVCKCVCMFNGEKNTAVNMGIIMEK
jgi:chromosome segregation ATPase